MRLPGCKISGESVVVVRIWREVICGAGVAVRSGLIISGARLRGAGRSGEGLFSSV